MTTTRQQGALLKTQTNQAVAKTVKTPSFSEFIKSSKVTNELTKTLGNEMKKSAFVTGIISAVNANPELSKCQYSSIVSAGLLGSTLNLSPSPQLGQYYILPFKQKAKKAKNPETGEWEVTRPEMMVATFVLGYKGYIQLAIRSGQYKKINVLPIKEGELIKYDPLEEDLQVSLIEDEDEREAAPTIGYYAMFELVNGFKKAVYWSYKKMMNHADKYSKAFSRQGYEDLLNGRVPEKEMWKYSSFWYTGFDDMAQKTLIRQLISKWGVMSVDMQKAFEQDIETESKNDDESFSFSQEGFENVNGAEILDAEVEVK